jgi:hypothetical protein
MGPNVLEREVTLKTERSPPALLIRNDEHAMAQYENNNLRTQIDVSPQGKCIQDHDISIQYPKAETIFRISYGVVRGLISVQYPFLWPRCMKRAAICDG